MSERSEQSVEDEWLRSLYDRHRDLVFRYAVSRVGRESAFDIVTETFIAAGQGRGGFDPAKGTEAVWLLGVATNQIRRWWRTESKYADLGETQAQSIGGEDQGLASLPERIDAERNAATVEAAVTDLPDGERAAILLHAVEGLSISEVAGSLQISKTAAKVRVFRARRRLRESLAHLAESEEAA